MAGLRHQPTFNRPASTRGDRIVLGLATLGVVISAVILLTMLVQIISY